MKAIHFFMKLAGLLIAASLPFSAIDAAAQPAKTRLAKQRVANVRSISAQSANEMNQVIASMKQSSRTIRTIYARMNQVKRNTQVGGPPETSNAEMYIEHRPGSKDDQVKITYTDGKVAALVGNDAIYYEPNNNHVFLINRRSLFQGEKKIIPDPYAFVFDLPKYYHLSYLGRGQVGRYATSVIKLTPKDNNEDSLYRQLFTVWIDRISWLPVKYEAVEENGDVITITLSNVRKNGAIPPGTFKVVWKPGTKEDRVQ